MRRLILLAILFAGCRSHGYRPVVEFKGWYGQESDLAAGQKIQSELVQELHHNPACSNIIFVRNGEGPESVISLAIEMPDRWHLFKPGTDTQGTLKDLSAAVKEICTRIGHLDGAH